MLCFLAEALSFFLNFIQSFIWPLFYCLFTLAKCFALEIFALQMNYFSVFSPFQEPYPEPRIHNKCDQNGLHRAR
jgi:hypothetical protein